MLAVLSVVSSVAAFSFPSLFFFQRLSLFCSSSHSSTGAVTVWFNAHYSAFEQNVRWTDAKWRVDSSPNLLNYCFWTVFFFRLQNILNQNKSLKESDRTVHMFLLNEPNKKWYETH